MADEPSFPKPRQKQSAYREPAAQPFVASAPARAPRVVTRAEPPSEVRERTRIGEAHTILAGAGEERAYWAKERFTARYPRVTGAVLLALSAFLLFPAVAARLSGVSFHGGRGTALGALAFTSSIWLLVAKLPLDRNGRPPAWWSTGMTVAIALGVVIAILL